jgi:hypothetical protein
MLSPDFHLVMSTVSQKVIEEISRQSECWLRVRLVVIPAQAGIQNLYYQRLLVSALDARHALSAQSAGARMAKPSGMTGMANSPHKKMSVACATLIHLML